jgi:cytochrome c-type biogenesis protein CcmH/NrfF
VVEKRMVAISAELRCLVCQNESLAGSRADLAMDLKREIRSQIQAGKSDAEIMDFMVSRYGDFVRYRPPVNPVTWLLVWPFVLLAGAAYGLRMVRGNQRSNTRRGPARQAPSSQDTDNSHDLSLPSLRLTCLPCWRWYALAAAQVIRVFPASAERHHLQITRRIDATPAAYQPRRP